MDFESKKVLVAYFSRKGFNYGGGKITDLVIGNTAIAARKLAAQLGEVDTFEIVPTVPYPDDYSDCTAVAKNELRANVRPKIKNDANTDNYDVIFLGYPNWWGTMPMPVCTFLEMHDFSGKIICPFCTNEGSGMGVSEKDIKDLCGGAIVMMGLPIIGSHVALADNNIKQWLLSLKANFQ